MADLPPPVETTVHIVDDKDRKIRDYATPGADQFASGIPRPDANNRFELKPVMFQMLQTMGQFGGSTVEDPHAHLKSFLEVADSFHIPGVAEDAVRLRLFPFTLRDRAKAWINSFRPNSLISWKVLAEKFLQKYFPPTRNVKLRNEIILFRQGEDETVSDAWERFKELLRQCPHHGIPHCIQLETFYNGLSNTAKLILDATAGGAFTTQTYNEGVHTPSGHSPQNFHQGQSPQNFQQRQPPALEAPPSLESVLKGFMNQTQAAMRNFETRLGQLATEVKNRPQGSLPSDTEHPKREGKEQVKMISLRSADNLYDVVVESEPTLVDLEPTATTVPLSTVPTPDPTEVSIPLGVSTPVTDHPLPPEPQKSAFKRRSTT
ncbi:hypothetical protein OSB04_029370 [Centaurea solstitialis]|uniref:Retrotransposon gag domain-containing protein n=1 Tax=Centaurea solstitialis TaxID=347529 RepID=A0AA38SHF2_9ASTR|nr:hypothetical protein OSB04_029370 [Centaurea solstitialis]